MCRNLGLERSSLRSSRQRRVLLIGVYLLPFNELLRAAGVTRHRGADEGNELVDGCRKFAHYGRKAGSISGCDFSGTVEEIGLDVAPGLRIVGERVASMVHGGTCTS